jgi:AraC-like DNA-binding protein
MQLAAQMLRSTSKSVAEVAGDVGYESEPSFNRAFKREWGLPPARFRTQARSSPVVKVDASTNGRRKVSGVKKSMAAASSTRHRP